MFSKMQKACELLTNDSCARHIHLSPSDGFWETKELQWICKAILYFEEAMEVLSPEARRRSKLCRSNRFNNAQFLEMSGTKTKRRDLAECFQVIENCKNIQSLAELMGMRKFMAWNFVKVFSSGWSDKGGTIEFRRPPGVTNPDDCLAWMELAVHFIQAARELQGSGFRLGARYTRDVSGLRQFIHDGRPGRAPKPAYMQRLFSGKSGRIEPMIHIDPPAYEPGESTVEGQRGNSAGFGGILGPRERDLLLL